MYKRKTRHDYENFRLDIQEEYLCRKNQFGHHKAGRFLKEQFCLIDSIDLFYTLEVARQAINFMFTTIKIIKNSKEEIYEKKEGEEESTKDKKN